MQEIADRRYWSWRAAALSAETAKAIYPEPAKADKEKAGSIFHFPS